MRRGARTVPGGSGAAALLVGFLAWPAGMAGAQSGLPVAVAGRSGPVGDGDGQALDVRVMSFNIRYGTANDGEDAWPNRRAQVAAVIEGFGPTVLGVQEALAFQLGELDGLLPGYDRVGVGRDDAREAGEFSAIYYDAARLEVIGQGTFWFSESPAEPGTTAWGATIPRICTWARFRDVSTGRTFFVYNNHWDHQSQESRERSAALLMDRIAAREPAADPVIVTGDFNAGEDNRAFERLVTDVAVPLSDTYRTLHPSTTGVGTFNGFSGETGGPKIDAVLATRDWTVVSARIDRSNVNGRFPSDHFPVTAVLRYRPEAGPADGVRLVVRTEAGDFEIEVDPSSAPVTTANFLRYVDAGAYSNGTFHRTVRADNQPTDPVKIDVIQASRARGAEGYGPIPLERTSATGLRHVDGAISMARAGPDTAVSDFFICIGAQPELDFGGARNPDGQGFAVFGRVVSGMDVVRRIHQSPADGQRLAPRVGIVTIERKVPSGG